MQYWLFKSEPDTWSWTQQVLRGDRGEPWTGVRNYQARNFMRQMRIGDQGFFYHSVKEKAIVGVVTVIREAYPDPTDQNGVFDAVDVVSNYPIQVPITLNRLKAIPELSQILLLKQSRLSVMPIPPEAWFIMCQMDCLP